MNASTQSSQPFSGTTTQAETVQRAQRVMGPIMAGVIIDIMDAVTFGPVGLAVGIPIGGIAGYWLGKCLGLGPRGCWICAAAAGIYCSIPFTEFVPLGSLVGAYARFMELTPAPPQPAPPTTVDGTVLRSNVMGDN